MFKNLICFIPIKFYVCKKVKKKYFKNLKSFILFTEIFKFEI
jgi:hypothetical protein